MEESQILFALRCGRAIVVAPKGPELDEIQQALKSAGLPLDAPAGVSVWGQGQGIRVTGDAAVRWAESMGLLTSPPEAAASGEPEIGALLLKDTNNQVFPRIDLAVQYIREGVDLDSPGAPKVTDLNSEGLEVYLWTGEWTRVRKPQLGGRSNGWTIIAMLTRLRGSGVKDPRIQEISRYKPGAALGKSIGELLDIHTKQMYVYISFARAAIRKALLSVGAQAAETNPAVSRILQARGRNKSVPCIGCVRGKDIYYLDYPAYTLAGNDMDSIVPPTPADRDVIKSKIQKGVAARATATALSRATARRKK
ncbi:MAG: hypothetical protein GMKNLPBB_02098 [Myxococcota bacterium]|nr:hypothetical protein [Myxococcota bacterium]